jgi:hypothetical protein
MHRGVTWGISATALEHSPSGSLQTLFLLLAKLPGNFRDRVNWEYSSKG